MPLTENTAKTENPSFFAYLEEVKWTACFLGIVTLMTHGALLFSERIGADTDTILVGQYEFLKNGRQGLYYLGLLFQLLNGFSPYMVQGLTVFFAFLAPILMGYVFVCEGGQRRFRNCTLCLLGLSMIVSPLLVEQFYFLNQSTQISFSFVLLPIALICSNRAFRGGKNWIWYCMAAILLLYVIFGCYQVMLFVYVTAVASLFLFRFRDGEVPAKEQVVWTIQQILIFAVSAITYFLVAKLFHSQLQEYLDGQMGWSGAENSGSVFYQIADGVRQLFGGTEPYYTGWYIPFALLLVFTTAIWMIRSKKAVSRIVLYFVAEVFLICMPLLLVVVCGGTVLPRMQLVLPLDLGVVMALTCMNLAESPLFEKGILRTVLSAVLILLVFVHTVTNMKYATRLYYTDACRYEQDVRIAQKVAQDINDYIINNGLDFSITNRLIILGYPELSYNDACYPQSQLAQSMFAFDSEDDTNRPRLYQFMKEIGANFGDAPYYSELDRKDYYEVFEDYFGVKVDEMIPYPYDGYIQYMLSEDGTREYLVVRMSSYWRGNIEAYKNGELP